MTNRLRSFCAAWLALISVGLSGCDLLTVACTTELRFGVNVRLQAVGGGDITTSSFTVSATDGSYRDEFTLDQEYTGSPSIGLAPERAGRYTIEVTAEGYEPWEFGPVFVFDDECHVEPVSFAAELTPLTS